MFEILKDEPYLIIPVLALIIPIFGIVFGTITNCISSVRRAEIEASLKHEMLNRGMSAEDIKTVIEASDSKKGRGCKEEMASRR